MSSGAAHTCTEWNATECLGKLKHWNGFILHNGHRQQYHSFAVFSQTCALKIKTIRCTVCVLVLKTRSVKVHLCVYAVVVRVSFSLALIKFIEFLIKYGSAPKWNVYMRNEMTISNELKPFETDFLSDRLTKLIFFLFLFVLISDMC